MMAPLAERLAIKNDRRIIFLVLDGLGDLPFGSRAQTPLEAARKPNIDALLPQACTGLFDPVEPGITPGSGPGHLGLFGYDPREHEIGRGVLEALGIDFPLTDDDVAGRFNFCTLDARRQITDRRAGRISDDENRRVVAKLNANLRADRPVEVIVRSVSEHRGLVVLRGPNLGGRVTDTDPQATSVAPLTAKGLDSASAGAAECLNHFVAQAERILQDEPKVNGILLRGIDKKPPIPKLSDRFALTPAAIATYPMYRGIARLVGMTIFDPPTDIASTVSAAAAAPAQFDYLFLHVKYTDKAGEDGDYDRKVAVIEEVDGQLPVLMKARPDVMVITGDHSTPAALKSHSWHPVPALLFAPGTVRPDGSKTFGERAAQMGGLGRFPMRHLLPLALAHAQKLAKFGA
ncbi:MAG: 2,3-bisphosphoglycerate-independent phosphoglycerate mutase [candidate division Zixibacteria bacterium]|nr:2,3-bisphosphoglycerate-independent phosphoglycerate mutase [candidate division Zixibacteria bacterium]